MVCGLLCRATPETAVPPSAPVRCYHLLSIHSEIAYLIDRRRPAMICVSARSAFGLLRASSVSDNALNLGRGSHRDPPFPADKHMVSVVAPHRMG